MGHSTQREVRGFCVSPVTSSRCRVLKLFPKRNLDVDITGLNNKDIFQQPSAIINQIEALHKDLNNGVDVQVQIDQFCLPLFFHHQNALPDEDKTWKVLMPKLSDVFNPSHLYDMGVNIRALSANNFSSSDVFSRLIQYSLPYVKHNRLTFPKYDDVNTLMLMRMIQIILACCLGIHEINCKKPLWQLRFRIIMYVYTLLSFGSTNDMYEFCSQNLNLLRIAIIEYFIVHVETNMPCEYKSMQYLFGTKTNISYIFSQFKQNINLFRGLHMQTPTLNWSVLNGKAHGIIEKCNRICKGKPRMANKTYHNSLTNMINAHALCDALKHCYWSNNTQTMNFQIISHRLRNNIRFSILPQNVIQLQLRALERAMSRDSVCNSDSFNLHVCVSCLENKTFRHKNLLRTDSYRAPFCNSCKSSENVITINLLGRLLYCFEQVHYFCPFCLQVHVWQGTGTEFSSCHLQNKKDEKISRTRICAICDRPHNVHSFSVLDSTLGIQQHFYLCGKHQPYSHQLALIHDMDSLLTAVSVKNTRSRYI